MKKKEQSGKKEIQKTITDYYNIFKEYIITLRDAKRYVNQVRVDYSSVRGDVVIYECNEINIKDLVDSKSVNKLIRRKR